jgi:clan AA aspartic protease (TIGR02281 family)
MSTFATAAISFVAGVALAAWVTSGHETAPPSRPVAPAASPAVSPKNSALPESFRSVVRVPVSDENQCFVTASSRSRNFRALIDTGADGVYLDRATARLLGFNPVRLAYDGEVWTATGKDSTAWVRLPELDVAGFKLRDVPASVRYGNPSTSITSMRSLFSLFWTCRAHHQPAL